MWLGDRNSRLQEYAVKSRSYYLYVERKQSEIKWNSLLYLVISIFKEWIVRKNVERKWSFQKNGDEEVWVEKI